MSEVDEIKNTIRGANNYLENHAIEVFYIADSEGKLDIPTNVKVKLTGIKNYLSMGESKPYVQFTAYILPTSEDSDYFNSMTSLAFGRETEIKTFDYGAYQQFGWVISKKLSELLKYFSLPESMLTKVVNEVKPMKLNESLITEGRFDYITREIVQDIIKIYKHQREGEFSLPEDLYNDREVYVFKGVESPFSVGLDLSISEDIEDFDIDADYYNEEDLILVTIVSNPNLGYGNIQEIIGELNETLRHELEHIKQHEQGYKFPKEPKVPAKYYVQQHEIDAQIAGFKRRAKQEGKTLETVIRDWFKRNENKHKLNPKQVEKIIQRLLK